MQPLFSPLWKRALAAGILAGGLALEAADAPAYLRYAHPTIRKPFVDGVSLEVPPELKGRPEAEAGFLDVTQPPFRADASGKTDCTRALQNAINYARDHQLVCFFPPGTYRVSDTLECVRQLYQRANGRVFGAFYHPCVLEGSRAGGARPRILLAPRSPGFGDPAKPKYLLHFWARGYGNPTTADRVTDGRDVEEDQPNISMNQRLVNLELVIGEGNPGAVAVRHQAAEGSAIEDCVIDATHGFSGIEGGIGSGGSSAGVTILGGRYGLDYRTSQPTPVITGFTLAGQTESAIRYSGRQTLVAAGLKIDASRCAGPAILASGGEGRLFLQNANAPLHGQISLVDSSISFAGAAGDRERIAVQSTRGVYLDNVYIHGAAAVFANPESGTKIKGRENGWLRVKALAHGPRAAAAKAGGYTFPVYLDGARRAEGLAEIEDGAAPPADLQARHLWSVPFPAWNTPGAVNVKNPPYSARGDGQADDTAALQRAINDQEIVFLPKGYYRLTKTLDLRARTKLIGAAQHLSALVVAAPEGGFAGAPAPLVRTPDDPGAETVIAFCNLWAPNDLTNVFALHWRSGAKSVLRGTIFTHTPIRWSKAQGVKRTHPNLLVTGQGGGNWYNIFEGGEYPQAPGYRHLLVDGAAGPLNIYHLSPQHVSSDAAAEIRNSRRVSVFGTKYEGNAPVLVIRDSDQIRHFGHGGNGKGWEGRSLFLVERTANFLLANLVEGPTKTGTKTLSGFSTDPALWFMALEKPATGPEIRTLPFERPVLYRRGVCSFY